MFLSKIATVAIILVVTSYLARSQQYCTAHMLPVGYPISVFGMQTCPSEDELGEIIANTNSLLQNEVIPALEGILSGREAACPATSCRAIAEQQPQLPSGDYWVTNSSGAAVQVYCDLTGECCTLLEATHYCKQHTTVSNTLLEATHYCKQHTTGSNTLL